ncbi:hypothetical protein V6N11_023724 [Hibiscus sabdariffa]|uniref:CCHC-type domain-containing protein n=1 Tax=Hibiscus sabdariffa TaxID=183260 RepID=A0ABR2PIV7_9ROSI
MNDVNEARGEDEIVVEEDHSDRDFHDSEYEIDEGDDAMFEQAVDVLIERDSGHLGDEGNESNNDVICFSNDLYSIEGSDNEEVDKPNKKWPEFNYVADMDDPIFSVGMLFADKKQLKVAVKNVSIKDRVNVVVKKDDKISCRKWDLSGIPCAHAISAIWFNKEHPEAYVDACYTVDTQKKIYEETINPIRGKTSWPSSTFIPKPPIQQPKQPGRPKTKRKKEPDELTPQREKCAKLRKIGVSMTCSKCGQQGHNKRSCKVICQNMDSQQSNDVSVPSFS